MSTLPLNRRQFLKTSLFAGGMLLSLHLPGQARGATGKAGSKDSTDWCLYVDISADNSVTLYSPIAEMGQHMKTTGPMILAEELDLDWSLIKFADTCPAYLYKNARGEVSYQYADMRSGGSHAVRRNWDYLRQAGATVRRMLVETAADIWQVNSDTLRTRDSHVINPQNAARISYGQLASAASTRKVDGANVRLKEPAEYRILGKNTTTVDIEKIVTGKPLYGIDTDYSGALQVMIHRAPAYGASVLEYNEPAALAVPGVVKVVEVKAQYDRPGETFQQQSVAAGVAVVAKTLWAAMQGKKALNTAWQLSSDLPVQDSARQQAELHAAVASDIDGTIRIQRGKTAQVLKQADISLDHTYETPLFAHACMEPHNCIADIRQHDATMVVGHQSPHIVAEEVEHLTGIDATKVEVVNKRMGGGFGRRYERDFLREAIVLSKQLQLPVKVTWTREDEIERDFFAPATAMRVRTALDDNRQVTAWHHRQASTRGGARDRCFPANLVSHYQTEVVPYQSQIPTGPWRGPGHLQWTFAVESMTDELAWRADADPLTFRLNMLKPYQAYSYDGFGATEIDSGRMAKCYQKAAELAEWGREMAPGHGLGIAGHFTFGSYAAFVLEVHIDDNNKLHLKKAWGAIDCGFALNPNHIRNQMEGGFIEGLNAALFNQPIVADNRVISNNFHTLRWMKMAEAPKTIEIAIINNDYPPTGVGEPPTAPAAAALTNAIFAASGQRIRRLPLSPYFKI